MSLLHRTTTVSQQTVFLDMGKGRKSAKQARRHTGPLDIWHSPSTYVVGKRKKKGGGSPRDLGANVLKSEEGEFKEISYAQTVSNGIVRGIPEVRLLADTVRSELGSYEPCSRSSYGNKLLPGGIIIKNDTVQFYFRRPTLGQLFYENHMIRKLCVQFSLFVYPRVHDLRIGSKALQKPRSGKCKYGPIGRKKKHNNSLCS